MSDRRRETLARWAELFETMTPDRVEALRTLCASDVRFRDPFNDVTGVEGLIRVFEDMYETCRDPRFEVLDVALGEQAGYLRWRFRFTPRRLSGPEWCIDGMSEVQISDAGLITAHLDHWDAGAQFYARLPVLRSLIGLVRRRLTVQA